MSTGKLFQHKLVVGDSVGRFYSASGGTSAPMSKSFNPDNLFLEGLVFDTVGDICGPTADFLFHTSELTKSLQHQTIIQE
jgi:hypothetical protein